MMKASREGSFLMAQIYQISGRIFAKKLKSCDLIDITPAQGRILFALWQEDNISIRELSQKTSLSKSTLTAMLDTLEKSGHVCRVPSRADRRKINLCLTEKDKALQSVYAGISEEMTQLSYALFDLGEIDLFENLLKRVLENLKTHERKEKNGDKSYHRCLDAASDDAVRQSADVRFAPPLDGQ